MFIAVEGGDAVGKTTVCKHIQKRLTEHGITTDVVLGHALGEFGQLVRNTLLSEVTADTSDTTKLLLFLANRRHIYENAVLPALRNGSVVVVDRWHISSAVYQATAEALSRLCLTVCPILPDLNIVLIASPEVAREREAKRGESSDHLSEMALQTAHDFAVRFRQCARIGVFGSDNEIVNADQPLEQVLADIDKILKKYGLL